MAEGRQGLPRFLSASRAVVDEPVPLPQSRIASTTTRDGYNDACDPAKLGARFSTNPTNDGHNKWAPYKFTQADQDEEDAEARQQAMDTLVASWMDRLSQMTIITTFFAAMETQLVGSTIPVINPTRSTVVDQIANAALTGALVMHIFAAMLSFFAAFFLIRYKLTMAKVRTDDIESAPLSGSAGEGTSGNASSVQESTKPKLFSTTPRLQQVGPFRRGRAPTHLLDHCHSVCMWLAGLGFILALAGVICFAWARLAWSGAAFASGCVAACFLTSIAAFFWPASSQHD